MNRVTTSETKGIHVLPLLLFATTAAGLPAEEGKLPDLPQAITSFGAAILGDGLYVYGGHFGAAHHYSQEGQSGKLLRLDVKQPDGWQELAGGPRLQGLAMVAHGGKLYRAGGFIARNAKEAEQDLWSVEDFASYDPQ